MVTDEEIRELAYTIWEEEGRPNGKDVEHYLRAKKILEEREAKLELAPPLKHIQLPSPPSKRSIRARHKKK